MYIVPFVLLIPFLFTAFTYGANILKANHCRSVALNHIAAKTLDSTVDDAKFSELRDFSFKCKFYLLETENGHEARFPLKGKGLRVNWRLESGIDYDS